MNTRTATSKAANATSDAADETVSTMKNANEKAANATSDAADKSVSAMKDTNEKIGNLVADTQKTMNEQLEKASKSFEGLSTFGQDNVEAVVKSSEVAAKAFEGIGSEMTAYSKKTFEDNVAAAQEFASAKSVTELFEKQTAFAQSQFEGWMHQTTKMNEIMAAAAKDITAPIGKRMSAAQDAMKGFSH